jgi:dihydrofolate reductase
MGKVMFNISMSLDGFITGPNVGLGNGLGDGGEQLHDWMFDAKTEADAAIVDEVYKSTGAIIMGKGMFDVGFEPWGDPPLLGGGVRLFEGLHPEGIEPRKTSVIETPAATHFRFEVV